MLIGQIDESKRIGQFQGEYRFLSNFWRVPIVVDGLVYPSVEHAYVAAKTDDPAVKLKLTDPNIKPGDAKRFGRTVKLIGNWEEKKVEIMHDLLLKKFSQEPLKSQLLATDDKYLSEGNWWGDKFWGVDLKTMKGENMLGRLIMCVRDSIGGL